MDPHPELPVVLSMLLCERVVLDRFTHQYSLIATVLSLTPPRLPATHPPVYIYAELTNGRGVEELEFRVVGSDEEQKPLFRIRGKVDIPNPLAVVQTVYQTPPLTIQRAEPHRLQLWVRGNLLADRPIMVADPKAGQSPDQPPGFPPSPRPHN